MITPPYIVWYHPVFVSCSHQTNILVFVLVGFLGDALDGQFFLYWGHIVTSIFRFCWFFLSYQSPIALSLCVFSLPPWQKAGQFHKNIEPGEYNNSNNNDNTDHHDDNTNCYYYYRRLASFVKILNQEDISKHQNHDTIQEVRSSNQEYLTLWTLADICLQHYYRVSVCLCLPKSATHKEGVCVCYFF